MKLVYLFACSFLILMLNLSICELFLNIRIDNKESGYNLDAVLSYMHFT